MLQQRNEASRAVGEKKRAGAKADSLIKKVQALKDRIGSEIVTHYPTDIRHGIENTKQEAWVEPRPAHSGGRR